MNNRFANMPFIRCELELNYYRRLQDAISAVMEAAEEYSVLQSWSFNKLYTSMYLIRGGTHWTRAPMFENSSRECCA